MIQELNSSKKTKDTKSFETRLREADSVIIDASYGMDFFEKYGYPETQGIPDSAENLHVYAKTGTTHIKDFRKNLKEGRANLLGGRYGAMEKLDPAYILSDKDLERFYNGNDFRRVIIFVNENDVLNIYCKAGILRS